MLHVGTDFLCFFMISTGMSEKERQMMNKLKNLVDKQRDEIRAKDHELTLKNEDVEAVRIYTIYSTYWHLTIFLHQSTIYLP